jgi:hypothetical protein
MDDVSKPPREYFVADMEKYFEIYEKGDLTRLCASFLFDILSFSECETLSDEKFKSLMERTMHNSRAALDIYNAPKDVRCSFTLTE